MHIFLPEIPLKASLEDVPTFDAVVLSYPRSIPNYPVLSYAYLSANRSVGLLRDNGYNFLSLLKSTFLVVVSA